MSIQHFVDPDSLHCLLVFGGIRKHLIFKVLFKGGSPAITSLSASAPVLCPDSLPLKSTHLPEDSHAPMDPHIASHHILKSPANQSSSGFLKILDTCGLSVLYNRMCVYICMTRLGTHVYYCTLQIRILMSKQTDEPKWISLPC